MTPRPIWYFFISSVWVFMGWLLYHGVSDIINYKEVLAQNPAYVATGNSRRLLLGWIVMFGMEFFLWYKFFRYPRGGARVFAAFMGITVILIIFISYISADLESPGAKMPSLWLFWYIGSGHLSFAVFGKDKRVTESIFISYRRNIKK